MAQGAWLGAWLLIGWVPCVISSLASDDESMQIQQPNFRRFVSGLVFLSIACKSQVKVGTIPRQVTNTCGP